MPTSLTAREDAAVGSSSWAETSKRPFDHPTIRKHFPPQETKDALAGLQGGTPQLALAAFTTNGA
eukprot:8474594-Lingulodinium_polyedra.AAC.1